MPGRIELDPVPVAIAGIVSISCECGWEFVAVTPEENQRILATILQHLIDHHGLAMPKMYQLNH